MSGFARSRNSLRIGRAENPSLMLNGAGEGIRTPDRLITNQLLYRAELRQPDKVASLARRPAASKSDSSWLDIAAPLPRARSARRIRSTDQNLQV